MYDCLELQVALLPVPSDNCAITTKRIEVGTRIVWQGETFTIGHTVLEGKESSEQFLRQNKDTGFVLRLLQWEKSWYHGVCPLAEPPNLSQQVIYLS